MRFWPAHQTMTVLKVLEGERQFASPVLWICGSAEVHRVSMVTELQSDLCFVEGHILNKSYIFLFPPHPSG